MKRAVSMSSVQTEGQTVSILDCERGFSLIEMLVSLVIMALMTAIAAPNFADLSASFDRMNARSNLLQDLKRAQAEALTKGCRGIFTIAVGGGSYSYGCDFLSYDTNSPPAYDVMSFEREMPTGVTISSDAQIIFNSRGQTVDENDVISTVTVSMTKSVDGSPEVFVTGTLMGTGLFSLN